MKELYCFVIVSLLLSLMKKEEKMIIIKTMARDRYIKLLRWILQITKMLTHLINFSNYDLKSSHKIVLQMCHVSCIVPLEYFYWRKSDVIWCKNRLQTIHPFEDTSFRNYIFLYIAIARPEISLNSRATLKINTSVTILENLTILSFLTLLERYLNK